MIPVKINNKNKWSFFFTAYGRLFCLRGTKNDQRGEVLMESLINIQKRLLPDLLIVMRKRYHILQYLSLMEQSGRRSLAASLGLTERYSSKRSRVPKRTKSFVCITCWDELNK